MENKNSAFKDYFAPIIVLAAICLVITLALALTESVTTPIIEANSIKEANATRNELLSAAKGEFEEYTGDLAVLEENKVYINDCYKAKNGSGIVVTATTSSYGGALTAMVGIDKDGAITAVKVTSHSDTPGVGTKAQAPEHLNQYKGLSDLGSDQVKKSKVNAVTGASVSSGAVHKAVYCALMQFEKMGGVK